MEHGWKLKTYEHGLESLSSFSVGLWSIDQSNKKPLARDGLVLQPVATVKKTMVRSVDAPKNLVNSMVD